MQLSKLETAVSKSSLDQMAVAFIDEAINEGKEMEAAQLLSSMEAFVKSVKERDEFKEAVRAKIGLYGKSHELPTGTKLEQCEVGTKYDFTKCEDQEWYMLNSEMEKIKDKLKARETFLKTVPISGLTVVDNETVEAWVCYPPTKISTSSFKVILSK